MPPAGSFRRLRRQLPLGGSLDLRRTFARFLWLLYKKSLEKVAGITKKFLEKVAGIAEKSFEKVARMGENSLEKVFRRCIYRLLTLPLYMGFLLTEY